MGKSDVKYEKKSFGLLNMLTLLFVCCKIFEVGNVADWSWWLVLTPLWIQLGIVVFVLLFVLIVAVVSVINE